MITCHHLNDEHNRLCDQVRIRRTSRAVNRRLGEKARSKNSAQTSTMIARVFISIFQTIHFSAGCFPASGFAWRFWGEGGADSSPPSRAGAVREPPRRRPTTRARATTLRVLRWSRGCCVLVCLFDGTSFRPCCFTRIAREQSSSEDMCLSRAVVRPVLKLTLQQICC